MKAIICSLAAVSLLASVGACRSRERRERTENERSFVEQQTTRDPNEMDRAGSAALTSTTWVANEVAVDRIARSRCAREMTCDAIGANKHFASNDACLVESRADAASNLKVSECPGGIDGAELDACLDAIRDESCEKSSEARAQLAACRSKKLCLRVEMPHR